PLILRRPATRARGHRPERAGAIRSIAPYRALIDFSVAKAIDRRPTRRTRFTRFDAPIATTESMSRDQAEPSALAVAPPPAARPAIASPGVLPDELPTGTTPLERAKLREAGHAEILRRIEEEPPKSSTRPGHGLRRGEQHRGAGRRRGRPALHPRRGEPRHP